MISYLYSNNFNTLKRNIRFLIVFREPPVGVRWHHKKAELASEWIAEIKI